MNICKKLTLYIALALAIPGIAFANPAPAKPPTRGTDPYGVSGTGPHTYSCVIWTRGYVLVQMLPFRSELPTVEQVLAHDRSLHSCIKVN